MSLSEAASVLGAKHIGNDMDFSAVTTDTRRLEPGELFVALRGPNFDGHEFLTEAQRRGAVGVIVDGSCIEKFPCLVVPDTRQALGALAARWRRRFSIPVIGITGSNGKTTVKEMVGAILGVKQAGLVTEGNLNNEIGVPLTLLKLNDTHQFAVIEMGMNHPGEIEYLAGITAPTVAVITNAGAAHLEGVGSVADVARAKGEIFSGLEKDGVVVINADDPHADVWRELSRGHEIVEFGLKPSLKFYADFEVRGDFTACRIRAPHGSIDVRLQLPGKHNVYNALAATAACLSVGATVSQIKTGLESLQTVPGRLQIKLGKNGARVIDDSYNANPDSAIAGMQVLAAYAGVRVFALGDMAELGTRSGEIHAEIGRRAREFGVDFLFTLGAESAAASECFGRGAEHFSDQQGMIDRLAEILDTDVTVLVKGSRRMRMDQVVNGISKDIEVKQ